MLFNSFEFLLFLGIVLTISLLTHPKNRWVILLIASAYFYFYAKPQYIILLYTNITVGYFFAILINSYMKWRKLYLYIGITTNLLLLLYYKYFYFLIENLSALSGYNNEDLILDINIILPVGISFYTFQSISYLIDVYTHKLKPERHYGIYALYISFFPQLVAGPIERSTNIIPQLKKAIHFTYENLKIGYEKILLGFFKKLVVADSLSVYIDRIYSDHMNLDPLSLIIGIVFFSFQIYCDFSGYSDIAIGLARIFNIKLMENFQQPYFAKSVTSFWRRWHISLSTWFKDYVFVPLGGSRVSNFRIYRNILIVFTLSGIWHGANNTFVIWGFIHGMILIIEKISNFHNLNFYRFNWVKRLSTFLIVTIAWVFFRSDSTEQATQILSRILEFQNYKLLGGLNFEIIYLSSLVLILLTVDLIVQKGSLFRKQNQTRDMILNSIITCLIILLGVYQKNTFIYFQF